jgi:hypothetical protein
MTEQKRQHSLLGAVARLGITCTSFFVVAYIVLLLGPVPQTVSAKLPIGWALAPVALLVLSIQTSDYIRDRREKQGHNTEHHAQTQTYYNVQEAYLNLISSLFTSATLMEFVGLNAYRVLIYVLWRMKRLNFSSRESGFDWKLLVELALLLLNGGLLSLPIAELLGSVAWYREMLKKAKEEEKKSVKLEM